MRERRDLVTPAKYFVHSPLRCELQNTKRRDPAASDKPSATPRLVYRKLFSSPVLANENTPTTHSCDESFSLARTTGLEPATSRVHIPHCFHNGMDYIFTDMARMRHVGTPVSSLYGALTLCVLLCKVPSVFAYLATLSFDTCCFKRLSLHRYPGEFQSAFRNGKLHVYRRVL